MRTNGAVTIEQLTEQVVWDHGLIDGLPRQNPQYAQLWRPDGSPVPLAEIEQSPALSQAYDQLRGDPRYEPVFQSHIPDGFETVEDGRPEVNSALGRPS